MIELYKIYNEASQQVESIIMMEVIDSNIINNIEYETMVERYLVTSKENPDDCGFGGTSMLCSTVGRRRCVEHLKQLDDDGSKTAVGQIEAVTGKKRRRGRSAGGGVFLHEESRSTPARGTEVTGTVSGTWSAGCKT